MKRLTLILLALLAPIAGVTPSIAQSSPDSTTNLAGSLSCRECHERFYGLWAPSHHGLAMRPFSMALSNLTPQTAAITVAGALCRADIVKGTMTISDAKAKKEYPIKEAMGGKNIFYFLTPYDRGRLQVLPLAYDLQRKEWYDTADSAVRHFPMQSDTPLHWTDPQYTFNTSCHSCHVSQLSNNYDPGTDTYRTTWAEPGINCETCHGPSAEHIKAARQTPKGQPLKELKLIRFKDFTPGQVNSSCGSCHAKMYPLTTSFTPGDRFFDHFGLTALEQPDFYPDGRDLGENFTLTTWQLSPCIKAGQLNCVSCHTSSGRYRFKGEQANNACLPCHEGKVNQVVEHSHHKAGSPATQCIACHMPMTEFARMKRSDHSMRPPMPAATLAFGSPNACNICHTNKDAAWADRNVRKWHPDNYQEPTLMKAGLIAAARKQDWSKLPQIVKYLASSEREEIWSSSLLQLLRQCEADGKWAAAKGCLADSSPMVRAAAIDLLSDRLSPDQLPSLLAATRDSFRLVRIRAASALAAVPPERIPEADRKSLDAATAELLASYSARPDDAVSAHNLGNFYLDRRDYSNAVKAYEASAKLQPRDISPLANLALAYNMAGQNDKAEASLRRALAIEPTNAPINLNLGMLMAEMGKFTEAETSFRTALKSDPKSAQAAYNLGILLSKNHPEESLDWCRRAAELRPQDARYAYTLAFFQNQQGKTAEATETLEKLIAKDPAEADAYGLLIRIYQFQKQTSRAADVCKKAAGNPNLTETERARFEAIGRALSSPPQ